MTAADALNAQVYTGQEYKAFGEFTLADVQGRVAELSGMSGWGPLARVAAVARGWNELGRAMTAAGARTVADLGDEAALGFAKKVWAVPPGGSLI